MNEALSSPDKKYWEEAAQKELTSLKEKNVYEIVNKPKNTNIIGCHWVFKIKQSIDGNIDKFKVRLVARGDTQIYGINYYNTSAPVMNLTTLHILLVIGIKNDYYLSNIDINTAYLNAPLKEQIYMKLPPGFFYKERENNKVLLLKRSLYGLKQSAYEWYNTLKKALEKLKFKPLFHDKCVFIKKEPYIIILGIYVDDILILSSKKECINQFKKEIKLFFDFTDNSNFESILGIKIFKK